MLALVAMITSILGGNKRADTVNPPPLTEAPPTAPAKGPSRSSRPLSMRRRPTRDKLSSPRPMPFRPTTKPAEAPAKIITTRDGKQLLPAEADCRSRARRAAQDGEFSDDRGLGHGLRLQALERHDHLRAVLDHIPECDAGSAKPCRISSSSSVVSSNLRYSHGAIDHAGARNACRGSPDSSTKSFKVSVAFTKEESAGDRVRDAVAGSPDLAASEPRDGGRPAGVAETACRRRARPMNPRKPSRTSTRSAGNRPCPCAMPAI